MPDVPSYPEILIAANVYDKDTLEAVGAFFLACATVETALTYLLSRLQCHPNRAAIGSIIGCTGTQNKVLLQKVTQIAQMVLPSSSDEVKLICEKIRRIFEHRNDIAHNTALLGSKQTLVVCPLKLNAKGRLTYKKITRTQVTEYTASLYNLIRHLDFTLVENGLSKSEEYQ